MSRTRMVAAKLASPEPLLSAEAEQRDEGGDGQLQRAVVEDGQVTPDDPQKPASPVPTHEQLLPVDV